LCFCLHTFNTMMLQHVCLDATSAAPAQLLQHCVMHLCCSMPQGSPAVALLLLLPNACRTQPLGVLHDLLTPSPPQPAAVSAQQQQQQQQQPCSLSAAATPWSLTVHYRNMPATLSNSWQNAGAAKDYFFSSLKVRTSSSSANSCSRSDGDQQLPTIPDSGMQQQPPRLLQLCVARASDTPAHHP
jgi:hypothetical protein